MSFREELILGKVYVQDGLYLGTYPGSLLSDTELGFLDGVTAGTAAASKALVLGSSKEIAQITTLSATTINAGADDGTLGQIILWPDTADKGSFLIKCADNAGDDVVTLTTPASTAAAITLTLPAVTGYLAASTSELTLAEMDRLDGITAGTVVASKVLVVDANKDLATIRHLTISGNLVTGSTTLSEAELGVLDGVTAGTVTASKALVVDASKDLSALNDVVLVNLDAGASGTAGSVDIFPSTASKGKFTLSCTDQTGDTTVTLNANAMGQGTTVNIADPGAAASYMVQSTAALTLAEVDVLDAVTQGVAAASKALVLDSNAKIDFAAAHGGTAAANSLILGGGTSGDPMTTATASKMFMEFRTESTATSGDSRCLYMRHAISGAAGGGEALRAFSKVNGVAASTVRGAHISIDFATSGSVTGFGAGVDAQVLYADETNASTLTCLNLEMYASGASTDVSGLNSFIRCVFNGNQTGIDNFDDDAVLFSLVGLTAGAGQLFDSTINTAGAQIDHTLKINIGGTTYYIPVMDNADGS